MPRCDTAPVPVAEIEEAIGIPFEHWSHNCHGISQAIVAAEIFPGGRVARGFIKGGKNIRMVSQHSWVVIGDDVFNEDADVIDPTLWSYDENYDGNKETAVVYTKVHGMYYPKGHGFRQNRTPAPFPTGEVIPAPEGLSEGAQRFLESIAPAGLDFVGWATLWDGPMSGWPSSEIVVAAEFDSNLRATLPIDIVGHCTNINPRGLYLPGEADRTEDIVIRLPRKSALKFGWYAQCYRCGTYTPCSESDEYGWCGECDSNGHDPYVTCKVEVIPCLTPEAEVCEDEEHHWGMNAHTLEEER